VVASMVGFWCGDFMNSHVMAMMKVLTEGRHFWPRTIGSTAVVRTLKGSGVCSRRAIRGFKLVLQQGACLTRGRERFLEPFSSQTNKINQFRPYGAGNPYSPNRPTNPYGHGLQIKER
jgi:hypothetical protein